MLQILGIYAHSLHAKIDLYWNYTNTSTSQIIDKIIRTGRYISLRYSLPKVTKPFSKVNSLERSS